MNYVLSLGAHQQWAHYKMFEIGTKSRVDKYHTAYVEKGSLPSFSTYRFQFYQIHSNTMTE